MFFSGCCWMIVCALEEIMGGMEREGLGSRHGHKCKVMICANANPRAFFSVDKRGQLILFIFGNNEETK